MSSSAAVRLSGLAMLVGAVVVFVTTLISALAFVGGDPTPYADNALYVPVNVLSFVGFAILLVGLPATFVAWSRVGALGMIGLALIFLTGLMFGVFFSLLSALLLPYLVQHAPDLLRGNNAPPAFLPFYILGSLAQLVGSVLVATQILRGLASQRWVGVVLILSAVMTVVSFFIGNVPSNNVFVSLVGSVSGLLILVALGAIGYELWSEPAVVAPEPAPGVAGQP